MSILVEISENLQKGRAKTLKNWFKRQLMKALTQMRSWKKVCCTEWE